MTHRQQHIVRLWVVSVFYLISLPLVAQHYIGMSAEGNMNHISDKLSCTGNRVGVGGGVGLVYEYHKHHFLVQTRLQYDIQSPRTTVENQLFSQPMKDTRGMPFVYQIELNSRKDRLTMHQISIPIMLGGEWQGVYFLLGAKLGALLHSTSHQTAKIKTAGDYMGRYYAWLENMPNHGYYDSEPVSSKQKVSLNRWQISLSGEIGYTWKITQLKHKMQSVPLLRVGAFVDCGLLKINQNNYSEPRTVADYSQYIEVNMINIYTSSDSNGSPARLLSYGLRITFLFPFSTTSSKTSEGRYPCRCYLY